MRANESAQETEERVRKRRKINHSTRQLQRTAVHQNNVSILDSSKAAQAKYNIRKATSRASEPHEARRQRLSNMNEAEKNRRAHETDEQRSQRLNRKNKRQRQQRARKQSHSVPSSRRELIWRLINQNIEPLDEDILSDVSIVTESYERDLNAFRASTSSTLNQKSCAVCGMLIESDPSVYETDHGIFDSLRPVPFSAQRRNWSKYSVTDEQFVHVCSTCVRTLHRNNIPRLSRADIPVPDPASVLQDLSFIEQMLISAVMPMVCVWRYKTFGQYQSKGQCVAFWNQV